MNRLSSVWIGGLCWSAIALLLPPLALAAPEGKDEGVDPSSVMADAIADWHPDWFALEPTSDLPVEPTEAVSTLTADLDPESTEPSSDSAIDSASEPATDSESEPTAESPDLDPAATTSATEPSQRQFLLMAADQLYLQGNHQDAESLYRQAKADVWAPPTGEAVPTALSDPADLPPAGQVYWREGLAGLETNLPTRALVPLKLLVEQHPDFAPGYARYAEALRRYDRADQATDILEQGLARYPNHPDLLQARADDLMSQSQWLEAAITAHQFAALHPDHPNAEAASIQAEENFDRFRREMRGRLIENSIANVLTGAVGFALTGGLVGPFTALNSSMLLFQGEAAVGARAADQIQRVAPILDDPEVTAYVNRVGQRLAAVAGRDEFEYEFFVIMDDRLNAFALPGGKIFINAGALMQTNSEAELAGLLAHEMAHAVLSHGFQMVTSGNLTASVVYNVIPGIPDILTSLIVSGYSRDMERQADVLGTQMLAAAGYAADGMHSLMVTLRDSEDRPRSTPWFASHPSPEERVDYLAQLIEQGGYNRFVYEGVASHLAIQSIVRARLAEFEAASEANSDAPEPDASEPDVLESENALPLNQSDE